jgi:orsellinic acid C2-O-methyltransferase
MSVQSRRRTSPSRRVAPERLSLTAAIMSCWRTQALKVAVELDLPDRLANGPMRIMALASLCDCCPDSLNRLMRALCALGVCREHQDGRFELTPRGDVLRREPTDNLPSVRGLALWWGDNLWREWGGLGQSVKTGRSARVRRSAREHYESLHTHADSAAVFHEAMRALTALICDDVAHREIWRDASHVVDVGGGSGDLAIALALAHPFLAVTNFDRADAEPLANREFTLHGVSDRVRFVVGDFFEAIPTGASHYVMKSILHNWNDDDCRRIVSSIWQAAPKEAQLVVIERIRPRRLRATRRDEGLARADLNMLVGLGGRERSLSELAFILRPFTITRRWTTQHEFCVVVAQRR